MLKWVSDWRPTKGVPCLSVTVKNEQCSSVTKYFLFEKLRYCFDEPFIVIFDQIQTFWMTNFPTTPVHSWCTIMCHQDTRFCPPGQKKSYNIIFETLLLNIYFNKASCASIPTNVTRYCIQNWSQYPGTP